MIRIVVEGELVLVIRFDLVEGKGLSDDRTSGTASAATGDRTGEIGRSSLADLSLLEIEEFNRLKAVHLVEKDKK